MAAPDEYRDSRGSRPRSTAPDLVVATNRVFHDRDHPSHLVLPIIDRA